MGSVGAGNEYPAGPDAGPHGSSPNQQNALVMAPALFLGLPSRSVGSHRFYIQLVEVEAAFKNLKDDLQLRPIYHQLESRIEAHIFVAFLAYCLHVTLRARLRPMATGLTPRAVLDKLAGIQMLDVHFPTTDGRTLIMSRCTEPNVDQKLLLQRLGLTLPPQPPPRIASHGPATAVPVTRHVVETFRSLALISRAFPPARHPVEKVGLKSRRPARRR